MRNVLVFSMLLVLGLAVSQFLPGWLGDGAKVVSELVKLLTMFCLSFIMIHVGYEFDLNKSRLGPYLVDYGVAFTSASFPWIFCSIYFVAVFAAGGFGSFDSWREALLAGRFAAPTSAGILFSMLAAAGLSATWTFRKTRILAIFDDLDTVLLMVPLKMLIVGLRWQLGVIVLVMVVMLWLAWRYLHRLRWPVSWPYVMAYAAGITVVSEAIYLASTLLDDVVPVHIEVLLPAFVLGCVLARPAGHDPHADDLREGHQEGPESPEEQRVSTLVSAAFMVLVGLSMPSLLGSGEGGGVRLAWGAILGHTLAITLISNLGKMFPLLVYRREATWRERLAVCVAMFPRGEVGAGILVVSLSYGVNPGMITVAVFSLALNLVLTGVFIVIVKRLLGLHSDGALRGITESSLAS